MEQQRKIRCVNNKTNQVRMISANVANNASFRRKYDWRIEELPQAKEEPKAPVKPATDPEIPEVPATESKEEEFADIPPVVNIDEVAPAEQPQVEKKTRKPRTPNKKTTK